MLLILVIMGYCGPIQPMKRRNIGIGAGILVTAAVATLIYWWKHGRQEVAQVLASPTASAVVAQALAPSPARAMHDAYFGILIQKSNDFAKHIKKMPTVNNKIETIVGDDAVKQATIAQQAREVYPILHGKVKQLIADFLAYKKEYGSSYERRLYATMSEVDFITRLITNRPLVFVGGGDSYLLRNGQSGHGGFVAIGTEDEQPPLILNDYISYDEMQIAALVGVSVPTYFINAGARWNAGKKDTPGTFEEKGIYTGLVGARFEKENYMEWQHMVITKHQNIKENGYGADSIAPRKQLLDIWAKFYGISHFPTYEEAQADTTGNYIKVTDIYLNKDVYKKRVRMSLEPYLFDADIRAQKAGTRAYVQVVGLGLGVWIGAFSTIAPQLFVDTCGEIIRDNNFNHIADVDFSYIPVTNCLGVTNGALLQGIAIHFSKRDPAAKLTGVNEGKLAVACYAWDGNAYPGNEYWSGALTASGDPAAACCSTIPELQNPLINEHVSGKYAHYYGTDPDSVLA